MGCEISQEQRNNVVTGDYQCSRVANKSPWLLKLSLQLLQNSSFFIPPIALSVDTFQKAFDI